MNIPQKEIALGELNLMSRNALVRLCSVLVVCVAVLAMFPSHAAWAQSLVVYPETYQDEHTYVSERYTVEVAQNTVRAQIPVAKSPYYAEVEGDRNDPIRGNSLAWAHFSFEGRVTVKVEIHEKNVLKGKRVRLLPSRKAVDLQVIDHETVTFSITEPGQYSLEVGDSGYRHGLMIFADPLETKKSIPKITKDVYVCDPCEEKDLQNLSQDFNTVFFKPRLHTIKHWKVPGHIKHIYLAGGALVKGAIQLRSRRNSGTYIRGRGTLDGRVFGLDKIHMVEAAPSVSHTRVEGIIIAQSSAFAVRLLGKHNSMDWIKLAGGWRYNNDGLVGYEDTRITNSFVWANDDGIKLYRNKQYIENIVIWHLANGGSFQWAWGTSNAKGITVKNIDVLHGDWPLENESLNQGIFNLRGRSKKSTKRQTDWHFKDVRVETPVNIGFNLASQVPHHVDKLKFENIDLRMKAGGYNKIHGYDKKHPIKKVHFKNLRINGVCMTSENLVTHGYFSFKHVKGLDVEGDCTVLGAYIP